MGLFRSVPLNDNGFESNQNDAPTVSVVRHPSYSFFRGVQQQCYLEADYRNDFMKHDMIRVNRTVYFNGFIQPANVTLEFIIQTFKKRLVNNLLYVEY